MADVPFPTGSKGSKDLPKTKVTLQNCFNNGQNEIIYVPGIDQILNALGTARGSFRWRGSLYQLRGTTLIKFTNLVTGAFSSIGTIPGSEVIETDFGFTHTVIVVKGGQIFMLDPSDVLTRIDTQPNFVACVDVAHIDSQFIYIPADGDPAFFSNVGAPQTVAATSFFDAESLPDLNRGVINLRNTLYILGENSIEPFRNLGLSPVPFIRVQGGRSDYGLIGGLHEYGDTFIFIGRKKDQSPRIYRFKPGGADGISNERIDVLLSTYTQADLEDVIVNRIEWLGYDLLTFKLRSDSFMFYRGEWFFLDTVFSGISRPWAGGFITELDGSYYTAYEDRLGKIADLNTNYGERITRLIEMGFRSRNGENFTCTSIELGISQGYNSAVGSVFLAVSRNNVEYSMPLQRDLGALGKYTDKLVWTPPGGLGMYRGFMGIKIFTTENVKFSADGLKVNTK